MKVLEAVAKLLCTEKSMVLRRFESGSQAATTHPTNSTPSGSIEEEGLKGPKKGDFNGQMSFATASLIILFILLNVCAYSERIDIVSSFTLDELVPRNKIAKETGHKIRFFRYDFESYFKYFYKNEIDKILIMTDTGDGQALSMVPVEKRILFLWEAPGGPIPNDESSFNKIYTFNDDIIDNVKYFKFFYPVHAPMIPEVLDFIDKKFCVMITHRFTEERAELIRFFETKPFEEFEYYGFNPIIPTARYRGQIPGHPVCDEKIDILKAFKFCICFENNFDNGYITEKIFTCFKAGCIPVYLGAPNVTTYIPKTCFIDYRDFKSNDDLYQYLKVMPKDEYERYLDNIKEYLESEQSRFYSKEYFCKIVNDCVGK